MEQYDPFAWLFSDQTATPVDPADILGELHPEAVPADAPPAVSEYRDADVQGVSCAFCTKFRWRGHRTEGDIVVPTGVCDQWEAYVDGVKVCDRYSDPGPAWNENGKEEWSEFADVVEPIEFHEIHLAGTEVLERDGRIIKGILRTGYWDVTPTGAGKIRKPLRIVRDGRSDPAKGVISMSEILDNFKSKKLLQRVQVPLAQSAERDHANSTRNNTGFIEDVWIEDSEDGAELKAAVNFTEPEVKEKVLRGTYADVSSGIPFHPQHGAFLEHVCITNTPFIKDLSPWLAASDAPEVVKDAEVVHHVLSTDSEESDPSQIAVQEGEQKPADPEVLSYKRIMDGALKGLDGYNLQRDYYNVLDATPKDVLIEHPTSGTIWTVAYVVEDGEIKLAPIHEWVVQQESTTEQETAPEPDPSPSTEEETAPAVTASDDPLAAARQLREARLASPQRPINRTGGSHMATLTRQEIEALELSDEVRAKLLETLDENDTLKASGREKECDARMEELKKLGFSNRPGALKLYRRVYLSDDGGPAIVTLSDDGKTQESLTALQILDQFIDACAGSENKVEFSDQHMQSGNDQKPPAVDGPDKPVEERAKDMREFLFPRGR